MKPSDRIKEIINTIDLAETNPLPKAIVEYLDELQTKRINFMYDNQIEALKVVLEFIERWNKKDEEKEVAEAAGILEEYVEGLSVK